MFEHLTHTASSVPAAFWGVLSEMAPYLLFGFLAAGVLSVLISPRFISRHLGGGGVLSVLKASAFGVPLPLCSCSVIPVATSLRRHGAGKGATTAFLISAPQTGVDSILVTFSLLGGVFAIFRPIVALLSGLIGGVLVELLDRDCATCAAPSEQDDVPGDPRGLGARLVHALHYGFVTLPEDIGWPLLAGLVVAALISALVPPDFFATALGGAMGGGVLAMLVMMLLGVPVYVCATASVPIAAALVAKGVSPGAALAFLMTGPATNAATIVTVWRVMGVRTGVLYLLTIMGTAMGAGLMLNAIFSMPAMPQPPAAGVAMIPHWIGATAAVVLLALLGVAVVRPLLRRRREPAGAAAGVALRIGGMTCGHCVRRITDALQACRGVESAAVDLSAGNAVVSGRDLKAGELVKVVGDLGYDCEVAPRPAATGDQDPEHDR
ncbi:MAG: permease [Phycisphaerae bacterium]|nr:permease [Phycisphaerae bacterium]